MKSLPDLLDKIEAGDAVLFRADLNAPIRDGEVSDDNRLIAIEASVIALLKAKAKIVLISHLGRPKGVEEKYSLAPVARRLSTNLGCEVVLIAGDPIEDQEEIQKSLDQVAPGQIALLENLRFWPGEKANDEAFGKALASFAKHYVCDAFGTLHRAHASVVGAPQHLPAYAGLLVENEIGVLSGLKDNAQKPVWVILGGAKVADKLGVVENLLEKVDGFIVGGGMANTFLAGLGSPVGSSAVQEEWLPKLKELVEASKDKVDWVFPVDFVAGDNAIGPDQVKSFEVGEDPGQLSFFDIGPKSIALFTEKLAQAKTIFWNGPLGVFEEESFCRGTKEIASAMSQWDSQRVIGGGDTAAAVRSFGFADQMSHISTGGGASLEYLEGKSLPGLGALQS